MYRNLRIARIAGLLAAVVTAAISLSACGSSTAASSNVWATPDVAAVQATPIGVALKRFGYTPVIGQYTPKGKLVTAIYKKCPNNNVTDCADNVAATATAPIVFTVGDQVTELQGDRVSSFLGLDDESYVLVVPAGKWRNFTKLASTEQTHLLTIMPQAQKADKGAKSSYVFLPGLEDAEVSVGLEEVSTTAS